MPSVWLTDYKLDADRKGPANSSFVQTFSQIIHFSFQIQVFSRSSSFLDFAPVYIALPFWVWWQEKKKENPQSDMIADGSKGGGEEWNLFQAAFFARGS